MTRQRHRQRFYRPRSSAYVEGVERLRVVGALEERIQRSPGAVLTWGACELSRSADYAGCNPLIRVVVERVWKKVARPQSHSAPMPSSATSRPTKPPSQGIA